jgi:hypothetical protein
MVSKDSIEKKHRKKTVHVTKTMFISHHIQLVFNQNVHNLQNNVVFPEKSDISLPGIENEKRKTPLPRIRDVGVICALWVSNTETFETYYN